MLLLRCHWFIHVFFWSDNSWLFVLLLPPPPSLQVTTAWCSHFSRTVSPSCPYGDLHPPVRSIPQFGGGGDNSSADLVSFATFFQQGGSFFGLHSLKIAIAGNIAGIYFGGACFQAFTQDRTGFVLHTVRYFCETSFSPYGFHFYTTTVRAFWFEYRTVLLQNLHSARTDFICTQLPQSFWIQYRTVLLQNLNSARTGFICTQLPYGPFEFTGRYNTSLSRPRGGGFSPSGSIPRLLTWSQVLARATTVSPFPNCFHDVDVMHVNFRVSKSNPVRSRSISRSL